jgi:hypothetical protein
LLHTWYISTLGKTGFSQEREKSTFYESEGFRDEAFGTLYGNMVIERVHRKEFSGIGCGLPALSF